MHVVTVEAFHSLVSPTQACSIYEGQCWLFRFTIQSPLRFFSVELPHVCAVFDIDPRQIYHIELFGYPGCGLSDVHLFISLFKKPTERQLRLLQQPLPDAEPPRNPWDILQWRFYDYIKTASRATKDRFNRYLEQEEEGAKRCEGI